MFDYKMAAEAELEKTRLEYTLFSHGFFMDYYGMPGIKSYMKPWVFAIDIAHRVAGIPGSGDTPAVYTYSGDVAKFVVATLSLPEKSWQKYSIMIGDRKTLNEILHIAESVCGKKFTVHYDSLEKMHGGKITELPSHRPTYEIVPKEKLQSGFANFGIGIEQGNFDFHAPKKIKLLNDLFPNITPLSVEELITKGWT
jgi:NmrA-like family